MRCSLIFVIIITGLFAIFGSYRDYVNNSSTTYLFTFIFFILLSIVLSIGILFEPIKYRNLNSKIILDSKGVLYKSKAFQYYIKWSDVDTVFLGIIGYGSGNYFIGIVSKHSELKGYIPSPKNIKKGLKFVHYEKEILNDIKNHWYGEISDKSKLQEIVEKKEKRKQKRLEKKYKR